MEPTEQPIKPTQPVVPFYARDGLTREPYPEFFDSIPPPPPPILFMSQTKSSHKQTIIVFALVIAALLVFGASLLFYLGVISQQSKASTTGSPLVLTTAHSRVTTPASVPTANSNYTAADIMIDFNKAGMRPGYVQYGQTIWSWTSDLYYVSVHATSSATFTDDSQCTGYCSPVDLGIWVYNSPSVAHTAYYEVNNDEASQGAIPMIGSPTEYVHGRCLILGASLNSVYVQVITAKCS